MRKRSLRNTVSTLSAVIAGATFLFAQDRLPQLIPANAARAPIPSSVPLRAKRASDLGLADPGHQLTSMSLRFGMTSAQSKALDQLLADQGNPASARYHQWVTPEQYAAQFGMSAGDLASARAWLEAQGFKITGVGRGRTFITFSGSIAQANQAFGVSLHSVSLDGETHISNLSDPVLPQALAKVTLGITGLNDFRLKPAGNVRKRLADAKYFGGATAGNFIAPADFSTIYDVKPLLANSINGGGVTIAVAGQTDITLADVTAFRTAAGLPTNPPTVQLAGVDPGVKASDVPEAMLDVEWAGAIAPSANVIYVNGGDVFANSMTIAIDSNVAPIVTVSYGICESGAGTAFISQFNSLFKQANAQGQTIVGPAGDAGASDCGTDTGSSGIYATHGLAVDFPASSPYVTAVGGTEFNEGSGTYWSTSNGTGGATALSYIPEQPWNETFDVDSTGALLGLKDGAGGGGVSQVFAKPAWQTGTGVPNDFSRDVPDISFSAAANHDGYLVCTGGSCANGFAGALTGNTVYGGTSVATPAFAGILALLEQKLGTRLGNVNPNLYGLANSTYASTVFHDVTSGNNAVPCTEGSLGCAPGDAAYNPPSTIACPANSCTGNVASSSVGYLAGAGYDLASGWGSLDVNNMVADWLLATPSGVGSVIGASASATTLSTTTPNVNSGASVTLNAAVTAGSGVTGTPTGTVQLLVDNVASGSAVALSGGAATLTYATTGLSSGVHVFSASYSGDTAFAGSKGSVSIDITSTTTADFSFTPSAQTVTVASGATASGITYTVTPISGFTGNVSLSASTTATSLNATYAFSVNPVSITTTAAGTTVLTLEAFTTPTTGSKARTLGLRQKGSAAAKLSSVPVRDWELAGSGVALAGLLLFALPGRPGRGRRWPALLLGLMAASVLTLSGCSGNNGTATTATSGNINTTPGTYNLTITASGTNAAGATLSHNVAVTLIVQ